MDTTPPRRFVLAGWLVEADLNRVSRNGRVCHLEPKAIEVLCRLAATPGEVVTREALLESVWPGRVVVDQVLTRAVGQLRAALGDDSHQPRIIETVARRGYRLLTPVKTAPQAHEKTARLVTRARSQRWALAAAILTLAVLAGWWAWRHAMSPPLRSVAVLPFRVLADRTVPPYYGEGLADSLTTALSRVPGLKVIARESASDPRLADRLTRPEIGRLLGVDAVVEGSIQAEAGAMRISARLVRLDDGRVLWAGDVRGLEAGDWFALEDRIVAQVRTAVGKSAAQGLTAPPTINTVAYRHYLRGRYEWNQRTPEGLRRAESDFRQALKLDPAYAQARSALAEVYVLQPFYGIAPPLQAMPRARAAARAALALNPDLSEAHAVEAVVAYQFEHDWDTAGKSFARALAVNPNDATARQWYAEFLSYQGRFDESRVQMKQAATLDPLSPTVATLSASPDLWARNYEAAQRRLSSVLKAEPDFPLADYSLALSYRAQGRLDKAIALYQRVLPHLGESFVLPSLANAQAARGDTVSARRNLQALKDLAQRHYVPPYKFAVIYAGLGETQEAFAWLEKAYAEHDERLVLLDVDPHMDPLRSDPRFAELRQRVGLPARSSS